MAWAAKVAPAAASAAPEETWALGSRVLAHDARAGVVALKTAGDDAVLVVALSSVEVLERAPPPAGYVSQPLADLDSARSAKRLEDATRAAEAAAARIGEGVTRQAQALFDAISKTHPCVWRGTSIVVMEDVVISAPYTPESCVGGSAAANERMRAVLAGLALS